MYLTLTQGLQITNMAMSILRSFYLLNSRTICAISFTIEHSVSMVLVFYYKGNNNNNDLFTP